MTKRLLLATIFATAFSLPALAGHCPADVKAIDHALPKTSLSEAKKAEVMTLRNQGETQHKAGQHKESVATLAKAMRILLNSQ